MLDLFELHFKKLRIPCHTIAGNVTVKQRTSIVEDFNTNPKGPPVKHLTRILLLNDCILVLHRLCYCLWLLVEWDSTWLVGIISFWQTCIGILSWRHKHVIEYIELDRSRMSTSTVWSLPVLLKKESCSFRSRSWTWLMEYLLELQKYLLRVLHWKIWNFYLTLLHLPTRAKQIFNRPLQYYLIYMIKNCLSFNKISNINFTSLYNFTTSVVKFCHYMQVVSFI